MEDDFQTLFWNLTAMPYEAHWWKTVPTEMVLDGVPSDCSDRAWVLAEWCEKKGVDYNFVWTLFMNPWPSLHVAIMIEGYVYDPIWRAYEYSLNDYVRLVQGRFNMVTGPWVRKVLR